MCARDNFLNFSSQYPPPPGEMSGNCQTGPMCDYSGRKSGEYLQRAVSIHVEMSRAFDNKF